MNQFQILRQLLKSERPLLMPDAYDVISARMIEHCGFKAIQCSGYSMAMSLGLTSEDHLSFAQNLYATRNIVQATGLPVMADGEDGYGSPDEVMTTVSKFINAGVSGINIEDQVLRNKNVKGVISCAEMLEKLIAARETAIKLDKAELVINARTDALAIAKNRTQGLHDAIERAGHYLETGANLIFVTSVRSIDEVKILVNEIPGPLSIAAGLPYNLDTLSIKDLGACGVTRVSLPTIALFTSVGGLKRCLSLIKDSGDVSTLGKLNLLCEPEDLNALSANVAR